MSHTRKMSRVEEIKQTYMDYRARKQMSASDFQLLKNYKTEGQEDSKILEGYYHPNAYKPQLVHSISDQSFFSVHKHHNIRGIDAPINTPELPQLGTK